MGVTAAHPWLTVLAVVVILAPLAVRSFRRANRTVEGACRDVKRPAPNTTTTPAPKETHPA